MKQIAYFGRKNHYGLRLYKNRKNKIDCVSGYLSRYINIDEVERRGSSANIYVDKPYVDDTITPRIRKSERYNNEKDLLIAMLKRIEATFMEGKITVKLNEPIVDLEKINIYTSYEYGAYIDTPIIVKPIKMLEKTTTIRPKQFNFEYFGNPLDSTSLGFTFLQKFYESSEYELNIDFEETKEVVDGTIPYRGSEYGLEDRPNKATGKRKTAFIYDINYSVLVRSFYADGNYEYSYNSDLKYIANYEYIEQCRAKYFYFVLEGTSIKREKTTFRFILDANGELVEPSDDFVPHYEKKLSDNPLLTVGAVYHSPEGDIPLFKWVAKNLLTKYKNTRLALEFEKALTPLYLSRDFDSDKRLDRPIRNGDYISIADVFDNWMGGTLEESFDETALGKIADKYLAKKKAELNITSKMASEEETAIKNEFLKHPLIYRVMNTNTKVKNDVGFQKCECLEVVDLNEIEEIFI